MDQNLQNYITQARASNQTDAQIMQSLLQSGWSQTQINEAFGIPNPQPNTPPPPPPSFQIPQNNYCYHIFAFLY